MKFAGIACLVGACCGMGWYFSQRLITQQKNLALFLQLMERMKEEIRYHAGSVAAMIAALAAQPPYDGIAVFRILHEQTAGGHDFYQAMKNALHDCQKELALEAEDIRLVLLFAGDIGVSDAEGQIAHCDRCIALVKARLTQLREKNTPRIKLFRSGGILAGIFLAIVLL